MLKTLDPDFKTHEPTASDPDFLWTKPGLLSSRVGEHWMDGRPILLNQDQKYVRLWDDCIPSHYLSKDNLPPFYVRLRDDQVGHLSHRIKEKRGILLTSQLGLFWPWDFGQNGALSHQRSSWGPAYSGIKNVPGQDRLQGGKSVPEYINPCLPLTFTSCERLMPQGSSTAIKREAQKWVDVGISETENAKKKRKLEMGGSITLGQGVASSMSLKKIQKPDIAQDEEAVQAALSYYDTLLSSVRRAQKKTKELEAQIGFNAANAAKLKTFEEKIKLQNVELEKVKRQFSNAQEILEQANTSMKKIEKKPGVPRSLNSRKGTAR